MHSRRYFFVNNPIFDLTKKSSEVIYDFFANETIPPGCKEKEKTVWK